MRRAAPRPPVPAETAPIARAAFPQGPPYVAAADALGEVFVDETFAALFPRRGQPALAPWRLALATILQFAEGLSDVQAADAVRSRIDWKSVLHTSSAVGGSCRHSLIALRLLYALAGAERSPLLPARRNVITDGQQCAPLFRNSRIRISAWRQDPACHGKVCGGR